MVGVLKAVLIAIVSVIVLILIMQLAFFFPFYMTVVIETAKLANIAATDNYLKVSYLADSEMLLRERPIFNNTEFEITVTNADGRNAVGFDNSLIYEEDEYLADNFKPYLQRGEPITVTMTAEYPIEVILWGRPLPLRPVEVSYSVTTIGLRYYKDLDT
ncbi:MAG: DUF4320 family protein [Oscillospiraceae bacterium]|nr:DUF4320 family protein [Oscillospiraceae bacterium]